MPRQIRDVRLQTREARQKLAPAKEPYWREIRRGLHVGYYKGHETGTWWLREIREGRRAKRRVGLADDHVPADGKAVLLRSPELCPSHEPRQGSVRSSLAFGALVSQHRPTTDSLPFGE